MFLTIIGVLLVAAVLLWALSQLEMLDAGLRKLIRVVVIVGVTLWIVSLLFGIHWPVQH